MEKSEEEKENEETSITEDSDNSEKKEQISEEQTKKENKILKNFLIVLGIFIIIFIMTFFIINYSKHFEYRGMTGEIVKEIAPYRTSIPVNYNGKIVPYYFYLRNDPRKLDEIPFEGNLDLSKDMVINITEGFNCDGDGIIGVANLLNLYKVLKINVLKDDNATCDSGGLYMYVTIQAGDETNIEQVGPRCYNINVNNCEILKVTERFMVETFIEVEKKLSETNRKIPFNDKSGTRLI